MDIRSAHITFYGITLSVIVAFIIGMVGQGNWFALCTPMAVWLVLLLWAGEGAERSGYDDPRATWAGRLLCRLFPAMFVDDIRQADCRRQRDEQSRENDG